MPDENLAQPGPQRYLTPAACIAGRLMSRQFPKWPAALMVFRDKAGSAKVLEQLDDVRPIPHRMIYNSCGPDLPDGCVHTARIGGSEVLVLTQCVWGGPQAAILVEELARLGVRTIADFGVAGSMDPALRRGCLIAGASALASDDEKYARAARAYIEDWLGGDPYETATDLRAGDRSLAVRGAAVHMKHVWIVTCACVIGLAAQAAMAAGADETARCGWLSPSQTRYHVLRVSQAPNVDGDDPLADAAWRQAEPMGPFFRTGRPEEAARATTVRVLCASGNLYLAARCLDPQPDSIKAGRDAETIWQDDSLEFVFAPAGSSAYPYTSVQLNAAGTMAAARVLQPFGHGPGPLRQAIDPGVLRVRTGRDAHGWWAILVLPLKALQVEAAALRANIVRNRPADGSDHAWCDLWTGQIENARRLQPVTIVDALPAAAPRLQVPARVAVGENRLHWLDWRTGCKVLVNDQPVAVEANGDCLVRVDQRGTASIRLVSAAGEPVVTYSTEVPRPLLVEAGEPFHKDAAAPLSVTVTIDTAAAGAEVTLRALQEGKLLGRKVVSLAGGTHRVELPCRTEKPGEVTIAASAALPCGTGRPIEVSAQHWCMVGVAGDVLDQYRDGLADLPTLSMYRAALADACNYFHLLQAGNGQYRSMGRRDGRLGSSEWNYSMVYAFALVYTADWPENPYHGDPRMLASAVAGMEAGLAPETWAESMRHPPNRQLQAYLLTYEALKDRVPADLAAYWRDRLARMVETVIDRWITPASSRLSFYSDDVGTGTNHFAYHLANIYTAGKILGRPDWLDLGRTMMRRLAAHERDGFFPEQRSAVVIHYTWLTVNAVGEYYWQSGDEEILPHLLHCVDFAWRISLPGGQTVILHDSRNNEANAWGCGEFVLSLTPEGRHLARQRMLQRTGSGRISRSGAEFWFRTAENAVYFKPGEEKAPPDEYEFPFLDGRALIARVKGFTYGLSAICNRATADTYRVDQQNAVELNHERVGRILSGANSQQQPEAGSFCRKLKDRTVFLPWEGSIERTAAGHAARLEFDTFQAQVTCEILSPTDARITVQLIKAEGDEPVVYSFFPVAAGAAELRPDGPVDLLQMRGVRIRCSQPVTVQRDFKIMDPYSQTLRVASKPIRAYTTLRADKALVLEVSVEQDKPVDR